MIPIRYFPLRSVRPLLLAAFLLLPLTGRAQMLIGSLVEGPASAPYAYGLTIQFANSTLR